MDEPSPSARFDYSDVVFPGPEKDFLRAPGMHTLYVAESLSLVKVGIASEPVARLRAMTCDNPHGIRLLVAYALPNAVVHWAEMYCHLKLLPFHHHGEWFRVAPTVARRVAHSVCSRAASSRGVGLQKVAFGPGEGRIERTGPPASLRMLGSVKDQIANPNEMKSYDSRRALERIRKTREGQAASKVKEPDVV